MAATTILNAHNLSSGNVDSSVVSSPDSVNVGWKLTGLTGSDDVSLIWMVQVGSEDYHPLKDADGKVVSVKIEENESGNLQVSGINASGLKIAVKVGSGITGGTLSLYSL